MRSATGMGVVIAAVAVLVAGCVGDGDGDGAEPGDGVTSSRETASPDREAPGPEVSGTASTPVPEPPVGTSPEVTPAPGTSESPQPEIIETTLTPEPADGIGGPGRCIDPSSTGVRNAVAGLGEQWVAVRASEDQPGNCGELLWVRAVGGNSAGAPIHVLFFHDGRYLGTATSEPYAFTHVSGSDSDSVNVDYKWLAGDEPFAAPQGGPVTITYTWTGSEVSMGGPLPPEVTEPHR